MTKEQLDNISNEIITILNSHSLNIGCVNFVLETVKLAIDNSVPNTKIQIEKI